MSTENTNDDTATCAAPKTLKKPKREVECGAPATHIWSPRGNPKCKQPMCISCALASAGNYLDEITPISHTKEAHQPSLGEA